MLDCSVMHQTFTDLLGEEAAQTLVYDSFIHRKTLWRKQIFSCDGRASIDTTAKEVSTLCVLRLLYVPLPYLPARYAYD